MVKGNNQYVNPWTKEEENFLRQNYLIKLNVEMFPFLKNRTSSSITRKLKSLGLKRSKEIIYKFIAKSSSKAHKGDIHSIKQRREQSETMKRKYASGELIHPMCGKKAPWTTKRNLENNPMNDLETIQKAVTSRRDNGTYEIVSKNMKKNNPTKKGLSDNLKKNNSKSNKKKWENSEFRKIGLKNLKKMQELAKSPESLEKKKRTNNLHREQNIRARLKGLLQRPTSYEKKIAELCIENSLPFAYTGDGRFLINFKNPDFVNEKDKIVIEVFYSWFKIRDYGSVENYKEFCRKKYESAGWRVIFIDETEVDVDNWKEICLNKIRLRRLNF